MKKYLGTLGAFYLGFSISRFADKHLWGWEFWAIFLPIIILFSADKKLNK